MSSRDIILGSVKKNLQKQEKFSSPNLDEKMFTHYDEPLSRFKTILKTIGGESKETDKQRIDSVVKETYPDAHIFCSASKLCSLSNLDLNSTEDPHELSNVEVAILDASFGVAENGTVWIDYKNLKHRVIHTIIKHLVVILPKKEIVSNLFEAYQRIPVKSKGEDGCFIAGPSKTADIEQSLVLGAHGHHSLLVLLID